MIIDLLGGSYEQKYRDVNSERTINWYPVVSDPQRREKNKTQMALFPRPGLDQFADLTATNVRGLFTARTLVEERCFAVVGQLLHEIHADGSTTSRGTMSNMLSGSNSKVYMAVNGNRQMLILDSAAAYTFALDTNTLTQVTDVDYPGATTLTFLDGYFVISDADGRVSFSDLNNGSSWSGDSVFTPTFKSDPVKAVGAFREEIFCFGSETIEVFINDGSTPFIRQARTSLYYGIAAPHSLALWHGGFFFLGGSASGEVAVYGIDPKYEVHQLSPPSITFQLNTKDVRDAEGFVQYSKDGHIFYMLHVPALKTTYVYDVSTGMWHERQSTSPIADLNGEKPVGMYRGRLFTNFKGHNLYGDWVTGKILREDEDLATDDQQVRHLIRTSPVFNKELTYISVYELEIDLNSGFGKATGQGSNPVMQFTYSMDGGNTFEPEQLITLGALGQYDYRVQINKLGTARNWVIKFDISDPINIAIIQARASGSFSSW